MRRLLPLLAALALIAWNCDGADPEVVVDCSLDSAPFEPCPNLAQHEGTDPPAGSTRYDTLEPGAHTLTIRARELCRRDPDGTLHFSLPGMDAWSWQTEAGDPPAVFEFSIDARGACT